MIVVAALLVLLTLAAASGLILEVGVRDGTTKESP